MAPSIGGRDQVLASHHPRRLGVDRPGLDRDIEQVIRR
jgi:hypothetical protein